MKEKVIRKKHLAISQMLDFAGKKLVLLFAKKLKIRGPKSKVDEK